MKLRVHFVGLLFGILLLLSSNIFAGGGDQIAWRPVTPEELQMKTARVEPDADAEAIFWEVRVDDKNESKISYDNYVRVKIFTELGRKKFSKLDIRFLKGNSVEDIAARVIKPDGTIVDLNPGDVYEREIVKAGKTKVLAKSFAVPGIEPGVIVEYQYKEVLKDSWANGIKLVFQRDIPMQKAVYYIRPQKGFQLAFHYYNLPDTTAFLPDPANKDFYIAEMSNVPAIKTEPYMPPDDEVRSWVYTTYYTFSSLFGWNSIRITYEGLLKDQVADPSKALRQKAAELTAGAADDETKLRRLYEFVQKQVKNITYDKSFTPEQKEKLKIDNVDEVLKKGAASSMWMDLLFGSLAHASGYQVGVVLAGDRSEHFFNIKKYPFGSFIHPACMAVKIGGKWKFYNPGTPYLPFGRLVWYEEGVDAMLVAEDFVDWIHIPTTEPEAALQRRSGKLKLLEDGTLEGSIRLEYEGQAAISQRSENYDASAAKREESLKDEIRSRMSSAELTHISIENFDDNSKPLVYSFDVRVPNYAQKTGKRLFVQPGFFEYGSNPAFTSAARTYNICFSYPWSQRDDIQLQLPAGFALDNADSPAEIADQSKISSLKILMGYDGQANELVYRRNFYFGAGGNTFFPVETYDAMKKLFDEFHKADTHIVTLKQKQ